MLPHRAAYECVEGFGKLIGAREYVWVVGGLLREAQGRLVTAVTTLRDDGPSVAWKVWDCECGLR